MTTTVVTEYFLIKPDWATSVSFKKQWRTGFQSSVNNTEKRSALFTWPRRVLSYEIPTVSYAKTAYLKRKLYKNLNNVWGIPYWMDESLLTSQAASGQKVLNIDSSEYRNYEVGAECIVFSSEDYYEIGVIDSITPTQITLVGNLSSTWPAGVSIYPILKARISKTQKLTFVNDQQSGITIEAFEEFDTITRAVPSIASFPTYQDYPIFNLPPDWVDTVEEDHIHEYELKRYLGASIPWTEWDETELRHKATYLGYGKEDIQSIIDFFDYHQGRWGLFWRPSWLTDIVITSPVSSGVTIPIENIDYPNYWEDTGQGSYVMFIWPDNSYEIRGVTWATPTTIGITHPLSNPITEDHLQNFVVSFISLCRFTQDEINIKYLTDSVADFNLAFQTVSKETLPPATTTTTTTTSTTSTTSSTASSTSTTSSTASSTSTFSTTSTTSSTASSTSTTSTTATFTTTTTITVPDMGDYFIDSAADSFVDSNADKYSDDNRLEIIDFYSDTEDDKWVNTSDDKWWKRNRNEDVVFDDTDDIGWDDTDDIGWEKEE